jgi:hypothetical protein
MQWASYAGCQKFDSGLLSDHAFEFSDKLLLKQQR